MKKKRAEAARAEPGDTSPTSSSKIFRTGVCSRPDRPPVIPPSLTLCNGTAPHAEPSERPRPKKRKRNAMEALLSRAEEATRSFSQVPEGPTWPKVAAIGQEQFARVLELAKATLDVNKAQQLASAAAAALRLSWAIGLAEPTKGAEVEWRRFLEDKLQEALQLLAGAEAEWAYALNAFRVPKTGSLEALLRHLDSFDQLLLRLWARSGGSAALHPAELSEASCAYHLQRKDLKAAMQSLASGTPRALKLSLLWGFRKAWLRRGAGRTWKPAPWPLRYLRARWLEASCLVHGHGHALSQKQKLQKAALSWQLAGRDASARCHGFAVPTFGALKLLSKCSAGGLVELGAGVGYWAALLRRRGVDVVALDIDPPSGAHGSAGESKVTFGDASSLRELSCEALLLCMPPPGEADCADQALKNFRGKYVAYVGEWCTGMTATRSFHESLQSRYVLKHRIPLPCYPSMRAECYLVFC